MSSSPEMCAFSFKRLKLSISPVIPQILQTRNKIEAVYHTDLFMHHFALVKKKPGSLFLFPESDLRRQINIASLTLVNKINSFPM